MYNKRILFIPLMALCLLSCSSSKDDNDPITPDTPQSPISFGGNSGAWQDAPTTRAGKTGLESLFTTFRVWGYKTTDDNATQQQLVMDGYKVAYVTDGAGTSESNTNGWEYVGISNDNDKTQQTIKYWDRSASTYRFFAYSPFNTTATASTTESSFDGVSTPVVQFSLPFAYSEDTTPNTIPYITDLWLAKKGETTSSDGTTTPVAKYGSPVTLTFSPLTAKLRFRFSYPDGTDKEISITDIQFADSRFTTDPTTATTPLRGTINVAYPLTGIPASSTPQFSWTASTATDATGQLLFTIPYEEENATIHIKPNITTWEKWYYVPPMNIIPDYEQGPYTMSAKINGFHSTATVPSQFMQWKVGYQYTYIFKISKVDNTITFADMQVEKWLPGNNIDNSGTGTEGW